MQFVLDYETSSGRIANIVCTQPRRISAIGLAERVSQERCSTLGDEVGYAIRGESKIGKDTQITVRLLLNTKLILFTITFLGGHGYAKDVISGLVHDNRCTFEAATKWRL